jgi:hypothetical protein
MTTKLKYSKQVTDELKKGAKIKQKQHKMLKEQFGFTDEETNKVNDVMQCLRYEWLDLSCFSKKFSESCIVHWNCGNERWF